MFGETVKFTKQLPLLLAKTVYGNCIMKQLHSRAECSFHQKKIINLIIGKLGSFANMQAVAFITWS